MEGAGRNKKKAFTLLYSGRQKQGQYGVAFFIMGKLIDNIIKFRPVSERIAYVRLKAKPFNMSVINIKGDALSATLFNIGLEYDLRRINKGTVRTRGGQVVAYADDIAVGNS